MLVNFLFVKCEPPGVGSHCVGLGGLGAALAAQVSVSGEKKRLCLAREHTGFQVPAGGDLRGEWCHRELLWKHISWA